jgi:hypothetical protein
MIRHLSDTRPATSVIRANKMIAVAKEDFNLQLCNTCRQDTKSITFGTHGFFRRIKEALKWRRSSEMLEISY